MIDIAAEQTHENKVISWFASKGRHGHPGKDYFARCSMGLTAPTVGVPVFHAVRAPPGVSSRSCSHASSSFS